MDDRTAQEILAELAALRARVANQEARQVRAAGRRRRGRLFPLALVALFVALTPLAVLAASPVFSDLDTAAPVHRPNIQAIGDAGITTGFEDPANPGQRLYNPKDQVTREEMASFLARTAGLGGNPPVVNAQALQGYAPNGLARVARASVANVAVSNFGYAPLASVSLDAPGSGFVLVTGTFNSGNTGSGCPCLQSFYLAGATENSPPYTISISGPGNFPESGGLSWVFPVPAGTHTFTLQLVQNIGTATTKASGIVTALYVPFGPGGGSTLTLP